MMNDDKHVSDIVIIKYTCHRARYSIIRYTCHRAREIIINIRVTEPEKV